MIHIATGFTIIYVTRVVASVKSWFMSVGDTTFNTQSMFLAWREGFLFPLPFLIGTFPTHIQKNEYIHPCTYLHQLYLVSPLTSNTDDPAEIVVWVYATVDNDLGIRMTPQDI